MVKLLSSQVGYEIDFDLLGRADSDDLLSFGEKVAKGDVHLGIAWGLEYGWLEQRHRELEAMAVVSTLGGNGGTSFYLAVPDDSPRLTLKDLKGTRIAMYSRSPQFSRIYLDRRLRELGETTESFFTSVAVNPTAVGAVFSVFNGDADCVLVGTQTYTTHVYTRPSLKLRIVDTSDVFPPPVLFGSPEVVNGLQPRLWGTVKARLERIHVTPAGRQAMDFWRMRAWTDPGKVGFRETLEDSRRRYPISVLNRTE